MAGKNANFLEIDGKTQAIHHEDDSNLLPTQVGANLSDLHFVVENLRFTGACRWNEILINNS